MMKGKGPHRFATLTARNLTTVQESHLKQGFELAEHSALAKMAVALTNEALDAYEKQEGLIRLKPGQLLAEHGGEKVALSIISETWLAKLGSEMGLSEVKRQLEHEQYCALLEVDPAVTYSALWEKLGIHEHSRTRGPKSYQVLSTEPLKGLVAEQRNLSDLNVVPQPVLKQLTSTLVDDYGLRPGQAEMMVKKIAAIRDWCAPPASELKPGQMVWLTYSTKSRRRGARLIVPVILTLLSPSEQQRKVAHSGEFKALKMSQIERMTTEAWQQNGVLTASDLEWLLQASSTMIRGLLELYQEERGIILPTAGTVLDMGRTLTHKKIVIEMSLEGMTTQEIATRIYHTPEAVDSYLKTFEKLLVLRYYGMPFSAITRVLGHGRKLIDEHLSIAEKHFPTKEALAEYLEARGVALEKIC